MQDAFITTTGQNLKNLGQSLHCTEIEFDGSEIRSVGDGADAKQLADATLFEMSEKLPDFSPLEPDMRMKLDSDICLSDKSEHEIVPPLSLEGINHFKRKILSAGNYPDRSAPWLPHGASLRSIAACKAPFWNRHG